MRTIFWIGIGLLAAPGCEQERSDDATRSAASASAKAASSSSATTDPPAPVAASAAPSVAPQLSASSAAAVADPIPEIPEGRSAPPTVKEWQSAEEINTQGPHSQADNCEMKVVREWLKVYCHGDILGHGELEGFGEKSRDYFVSVRKGKSADFVVRLRKGKTLKVKVQRADSREAVLFVSWPHDKPKPVHIALGRGKPPPKEPAADAKATKASGTAAKRQ